MEQEARQKGNFEALARRYSEDPETRTRAGSIGGVAAIHLSGWPNVLDAVATLRPGDISRVVSSEYGYHVFTRRGPVPEATVTGAHIVIAHADAPWIGMAARGKIPQRSRDDAFAIAARLYQRARENSAEFPHLVAEHSEHQDAARAGDFGTWSTREPTGYPREIETLAQLAVGEVAEPIDSIFGVQVIVRTPNRARERFATTQIHLGFDSAAAMHAPMSKALAFSRAQTLIDALKQDPARFGNFQETSCCIDILEVIQGREQPSLEAALAQMLPGEIADQPVESAVEYTIPKRLELSALPKAPPIRFELLDATSAATQSRLQ
jgi:parvulin-like peptidyl-prolyl isomerase